MVACVSVHWRAMTDRFVTCLWSLLSPLHPDEEIQRIIQRYRNIDVSHLIDRSRLTDPLHASSAAASSPALPFVSGVLEDLSRVQADPRNPHLELDAFISGDQLRHLDAIDLGFKSSRGRPRPGATGAETGEDGSAYLTASQQISFSQLDSFQGMGSEQDMDASPQEAQHDFSQHPAPAPPATAAAAADTPPTAAAASTAAPSAPTSHVFSSTHRFLSHHARAERAASSAPVRPASASNQAFVAAFGGVARTREADTHDKTGDEDEGNAGKRDTTTTEGTDKVAAVAVPPVSLSPAKSPRSSQGRTGRSAASSPLHHSFSPSRSPARALCTSLSFGGIGEGPPSTSTSQQSHHNLMPDSMEDLQEASRPVDDTSLPHDSDEDQCSAEVAYIAQQEKEFPFLTQAGDGSIEEEEEEEANFSPVYTPVEMIRTAAGTQARTTIQSATPSPSLKIPPTPSSHISSAGPSPQAPASSSAAPLADAPAVVAAHTTYASTSIEHRQLERRRTMAARLEAEELKKRQEEEANLQREQQAAQAAQEALEAEETAAAEAAAAAAAKATPMAAPAAAPTPPSSLAPAGSLAPPTSSSPSSPAVAAPRAASSPVHPALTQAFDTASMTDEDVCILAATLTDSPTKKRTHQESTPAPVPSRAQPPSRAAATSDAARAAVPTAKRARHSVPIAPGVEESIRRAMDAMAAAKSGPTRSRASSGRYQPLPLAFASAAADRPDRREHGQRAASAEGEGIPTSATAASAASSRIRSTPPRVGALPPFGTPFPISAEQVAAAVRYFRAVKRGNTQRRASTHTDTPRRAGRRDEDEAESDDHEGDDDDDAKGGASDNIEYSQWF